ncbi:hypothetical protein HZA86_04555 [Candidatus Uhrbacteria bacterium]|nr:hypothetical protein [Candidatus Uhrbacteria bacterium]
MSLLATFLFFGITRSEFIPGTLSFESFHYPYYQHKRAFRRKLETVVRKLVQALGLDNTLFDVELKCNPTTGLIKIIEINSRVSQQFMYLIDSVTGHHPFHAALEVAVGKRAVRRIARKQGRPTVCICFILRQHEDAVVASVPTPEQVQAIEARFPGIRINLFVGAGDRLSHYVGDGWTHRYAEVKIPGDSQAQTRKTHQAVLARLDPLFGWRNG